MTALNRRAGSVTRVEPAACERRSSSPCARPRSPTATSTPRSGVRSSWPATTATSSCSSEPMRTPTAGRARAAGAPRRRAAHAPAVRPRVRVRSRPGWQGVKLVGPDGQRAAPGGGQPRPRGERQSVGRRPCRRRRRQRVRMRGARGHRRGHRHRRRRRPADGWEILRDRRPPQRPLRRRSDGHDPLRRPGHLQHRRAPLAPRRPRRCTTSSTPPAASRCGRPGGPSASPPAAARTRTSPPPPRSCARAPPRPWLQRARSALAPRGLGRFASLKIAGWPAVSVLAGSRRAVGDCGI